MARRPALRTAAAVLVVCSLGAAQATAQEPPGSTTTAPPTTGPPTSGPPSSTSTTILGPTTTVPTTGPPTSTGGTTTTLVDGSTTTSTSTTTTSSTTTTTLPVVTQPPNTLLPWTLSEADERFADDEGTDDPLPLSTRGDPYPDTDLDPTAIGTELLHPHLVELPLVSPALDARETRFGLLGGQIDQTRITHEGAQSAIDALVATEARLTAQLGSARARADAARADLERRRSDLDDLAADLYIAGGDLGRADDLDWENVIEYRTEEILLTSISDGRFSAIAALVADRDRADREAATAAGLLDAARVRRLEAERARDASLHAGFQLGDELIAVHDEIAELRMLAPVEGTDFQLVALDAYYRAAAGGLTSHPTCGMRWEVLAAISHTEGRHGRYAGAALEPDGLAWPPIIGIALDGSNDTAVVPDSDGGAIDGDPTQDRAAGPMQFVPGSWRLWGADGNGDGALDPHNIYDAAAGAVELLCRGDGHVTTPGGLLDALLLYNFSDHYGSVVSTRTYAYDALDLEVPY